MSKKIKLTQKQKAELKQRKRDEKNTKIYRRLQFIDLKTKGFKNITIALLLDVCSDTLTDWMQLFETGGFKKLCKLNYEGRRKSILDKKKKEIEQYVKENKITQLSKIQDWLKKTHSLEIEHSWLFRYCKKKSIYPLRKHD